VKSNVALPAVTVTFECNVWNKLQKEEVQVDKVLQASGRIKNLLVGGGRLICINILFYRFFKNLLKNF